MTTGYCSYVYSQNITRNPSPPPLTDNEKESLSADFIGDTLFSKRFVLSMLLKFYKHDEEDMYLNDTENETKDGTEQFLNTTVENEACELWDSSTNNDVAKFIFENQGKDIFMDTIEKTSSPRLMEICFGILGNLMCVESINEAFSEDESFRSNILGYLSITDALSLIELTRLMNLCISNTKSLPLWINSISKSTAIEKLINILQNSLNTQLLHHVIQLIDVVFDSDAELMDTYADSSLFYAVNESYHVIRDKKQGLVPDLLYILQLVSTTEKGVQQLAVDNSIFVLLRQCIYDEQNVFAEKRPSLTVSVYSILGCLLFAKPLEITILIDENIDIFQYLITVLSTRVQELVNGDNENKLSYDRDIYIPVYLEVFHDICQIFSSYNEGNFENILTCLKNSESQLQHVFEICTKEDIPLEWKKCLNNLLVLNQQHDILHFLIDV